MIDELVARDVKCFHLEMMDDSMAAVNADDALIYIAARRGKLIVVVDDDDRGKLEVRK